MRRLFIIRKDLNLHAGKLAAMIGHCAECYWMNLLTHGHVQDNEFHTLPVFDYDFRPIIYKAPQIYQASKEALERGDVRFTVKSENARPTMTASVEIPKDIWNDYIKGIFTKTICEAKNLNHLMKVVEVAKKVGLEEGADYGFIDDVCKTDLTPEFTDETGVGRCRVGIWFKPLPDEISHKLSKKYQLYKD
jgi:peptidyl-tRNA hydrolase